MTIIPVDHPDAAAQAAAVLSHNGIAVLPCDTIYGIVGAAPVTEARIREIKGRGKKTFFLMLIAEKSWTASFTEKPLPRALDPFWPGPLTVLFPGKKGGKVGFRIPNDRFLLAVLQRVGLPLFSTSVNISGSSPLKKVGGIIEEFGEKVDLIVDGGDLPDAVPSTIVDITTHPYTVVRQGALRLPDHVLR